MGGDWLRSPKPGAAVQEQWAVIGKCVNKKFIEDNKVKVEHPDMSIYQRIVQRVRAVNGFKEWPLLYKLVIDGAPGRTPVGGRAGCGCEEGGRPKSRETVVDHPRVRCGNFNKHWRKECNVQAWKAVALRPTCQVP